MASTRQIEFRCKATQALCICPNLVFQSRFLSKPPPTSSSAASNPCWSAHAAECSSLPNLLESSLLHTKYSPCTLAQIPTLRTGNFLFCSGTLYLPFILLILYITVKHAHPYSSARVLGSATLSSADSLSEMKNFIPQLRPYQIRICQ